MTNQSTNSLTTTVSLILRVGLGMVCVAGGASKLSQLLNPALSEKIVATYWGASGYVNQFFIDFMFGAGQLSPWWFLTSLSAFEFIGGVALVVGIAVRPLSLIFGLLFWTFVIALPTATVPGVELSVKTYNAPAFFVQVRDIGLSGLMFVLYNLGPGSYSLDNKLFTSPVHRANINWDALGLLLRVSLCLPLFVGGVFAGMSNISSFMTTSWILIPLAVLVFGGSGLRYAGVALALVMFWYMAQKLSLDKSLIANLNGFKREIGLCAGAIALAIVGGGNYFTLGSILKKAAGFGKLLSVR